MMKRQTDRELKIEPAAEPPRKPQDVNRMFDCEIEPCDDCGDAFRFELESFALTAGDAFTIEQAAQVVSWRYTLAVTETQRYFDALDGFRLPH